MFTRFAVGRIALGRSLRRSLISGSAKEIHPRKTGGGKNQTERKQKTKRHHGQRNAKESFFKKLVWRVLLSL